MNHGVLSAWMGLFFSGFSFICMNTGTSSAVSLSIRHPETQFPASDRTLAAHDNSAAKKKKKSGMLFQHIVDMSTQPRSAIKLFTEIMKAFNIPVGLAKMQI